MKKRLVRIFLALVVIVLIGAIGGYIWVRSIVISAVEQAMGQTVTVTTMSLQRFGGTMQWHGLMDASPKGSDGSHLMQPCTFDVELELGSLLDDTVVFKKFEIHAPHIVIKPQMSESNISAILDSASHKTTKPGDGNDTAKP